MKKLILVLGMTLASTQAFAKDSKWMICKGETVVFGENNSLVVNVFEHRKGPAGRETSLTLLFGGWVLKGAFDNTSSYSGNVQLSGDRSGFDGEFTLDLSAATVKLEGTLDLHYKTPVSVTLKCEDLSR
ncbi:hypothetical protein ACLVWU_05635 [Bdellovibrio sp. HCB290]|uniref:hypothetical protein n=1 Tax=Bdellovibrio sp. HCB290 TaxID=3394356 RepID=UPI0039B5C448